MAQLDNLGAFALTEPSHGSDSVALETSARRDGDDWVINGQKKWIGNGTIADVVVALGPRRGRRPGQGLPRREGHPRVRRAAASTAKGSLRAVWQAEITLTDLRVPEANRLPGANSFKDTGRVLAGTRNAVAWAALGHATAAYEIADRLLHSSAPSSANRWSASRSCRTGWSRCSPRSARCSCTACGWAG